jgi:anti-sigma regulatory factor (Ser/Thr protein kinase)
VASASQSFPPAPESVRRARQFTLRTLASWGADVLEDDVRVVASELATNALLHARTRFTLTLTLENDRLRLSMADGSPNRPRMRRFDTAEATTGRGLRMVAELSQAWGVEQDGEGKAVWCEFPLTSRHRGSRAC